MATLLPLLLEPLHLAFLFPKLAICLCSILGAILLLIFLGRSLLSLAFLPVLFLKLLAAGVLLFHFTNHALHLILIRVVILYRLFHLLRLLFRSCLRLGGGLRCLGLMLSLAFQLGLTLGGLGLRLLGWLVFSFRFGLLSRLRLLLGSRCLGSLLDLLLQLILNLLGSFGGSMAVSAAM